MDYKVLRPHLGDKPYAAGDTRTAKPASVAHLVKAGVLKAAGETAIDTAAAPAAPEDKAITPAENAGGPNSKI